MINLDFVLNVAIGVFIGIIIIELIIHAYKKYKTNLK